MKQIVTLRYFVNTPKNQWKVAVCRRIQKKIINTLCWQTVELLNVKLDGTYNNHCDTSHNALHHTNSPASYYFLHFRYTLVSNIPTFDVLCLPQQYEIHTQYSSVCFQVACFHTWNSRTKEGNKHFRNVMTLIKPLLAISHKVIST